MRVDGGSVGDAHQHLAGVRTAEQVQERLRRIANAVDDGLRVLSIPLATSGATSAMKSGRRSR
jgi:hypothetical protein